MFSALKSICLAVLIGAVAIQGAPLSSESLVRRQIGNLQCNINRFQVVTALTEMGGTLSALKGQTTSDAASSAAVAAAQSGLSDANQGVATIAKAIVTGQDAPAAARTQVENGLNAIAGAIPNITSTDPQVATNVQKLTTQLTSAGKAGDGVIANCK